MTKEIVFLAPGKTIAGHIKSILKEHKDDADDIIIEAGRLGKAIQLVNQRNVEVIIARGGIAQSIINSNLKVTVVEALITGFDIIWAIQKAKLFGNVIAVVAHSSMVEGIGDMEQILGVKIRHYKINYREKIEPIILEAHRNGADVILGGSRAVSAAKKHNLPCVLINIGKESVLRSIYEARSIIEAIHMEKIKRKLFSTVLDRSHEGIIIIDNEHRITSFNPSAEKITKIPTQKVLQKKIDQIFPELKLEDVIHTCKEYNQEFAELNGVPIICNKTPIVLNSQTFGAVATFQEISKIQQIEYKIRQKILARGHIAQYTFDDIVGDSQRIKETINIAKKFAQTPLSILIIGESGTGKELFAQSIHNFSERCSGPFVAINCAALPTQILESELFGYVAGAFTGANKEGKAGLLEIAHGGTIFLDEIAELDYVNQGRLLRFLQEKTVIRLGSDKVNRVDVRVIAATNKNLKKLVNENKFRDDLFYRLNVLKLYVPPLSKRPEDIVSLIEHFLQENTAGKQNLTFSSDALTLLRCYSWPGNVRELQNTIEQIATIHIGETITSSIISDILMQDTDTPMQHSIYDIEIEEIKQAMISAKGKYAKAAEILGISRTTLWRKIQKLGLRI